MKSVNLIERLILCTFVGLLIGLGVQAACAPSPHAAETDHFTIGLGLTNPSGDLTSDNGGLYSFTWDRAVGKRWLSRLNVNRLTDLDDIDATAVGLSIGPQKTFVEQDVQLYLLGGASIVMAESFPTSDTVTITPASSLHGSYAPPSFTVSIEGEEDRNWYEVSLTGGGRFYFADDHRYGMGAEGTYAIPVNHEIRDDSLLGPSTSARAYFVFSGAR